jgi:uncharacterized protein YacL
MKRQGKELIKSKKTDPAEPIVPEKTPEAAKTTKAALEAIAKPSSGFTKALAEEIVKGLTSFRFTPFRFRHEAEATPGEEKIPDLGIQPILMDSSVLIDGRILPIVNSGFLTGTVLIPQFVLAEVQHIADSSDSLRRAKGRRGLDIVTKLKWQRVNPLVKVKIIEDDPVDVKEVDHKLVALAKRWRNLPEGRNIRLLTVDFNLAHLARAQGVAILNVFDMAQALKLTLVPGEELIIKISHEGKEREQGVGYLSDGTMVVVDDAKDKVGTDLAIVVTKIHQTPAGQLFFARLK